MPGGQSGGCCGVNIGGLIPGGNLICGEKKNGGGGGIGVRIPAGGLGMGGGINIGGRNEGGGGRGVNTSGCPRLKKLSCNSTGGRGKAPGSPGTGSNTSFSLRFVELVGFP